MEVCFFFETRSVQCSSGGVVNKDCFIFCLRNEQPASIKNHLDARNTPVVCSVAPCCWLLLLCICDFALMMAQHRINRIGCQNASHRARRRKAGLSIYGSNRYSRSMKQCLLCFEPEFALCRSLPSLTDDFCSAGVGAQRSSALREIVYANFMHFLERATQQKD